MALDLRGVCPLLQVYDMPVSIAFYRDMLGFEVISTSREGPTFDWAWLRLNGTELMLNTAYEEDSRPPVRDPLRVAGHADTILYFGAPDVDAVYMELCAQGFELKPPRVTHYGMKQLYLQDPDGFELCFQWRT